MFRRLVVIKRTHPLVSTIRVIRGSAAPTAAAARLAAVRCIEPLRSQSRSRSVTTTASGTSTAVEAYQAVFIQWQRLNGDGLKSLSNNELERAEAQFISAANACATFTQTVGTAALYTNTPTAAGDSSGSAASDARVTLLPNAPPPAVHRALSLHNLGAVYMKMKKPDSARKVFTDAYDILKMFTLSDYQVVGNVCTELAKLESAAGNVAEALRYYNLAYSYFDRSHHRDAPSQAALALYSTAMLHHSARDLASAERTYTAALELARLAFGPRHRNVGQVAYSLGHLRVDQQNFAAAKELYMTAATVLQEAKDPTFLKAMADYTEVLFRLTEDEQSKVQSRPPPPPKKPHHPVAPGYPQITKKNKNANKSNAAATATATTSPTAAAAAAAAASAPLPTPQLDLPSDPVERAKVEKARARVARIEQMARPAARNAAYSKLMKDMKTDEWAQEFETEESRTAERDAEAEAKRIATLNERLEQRRLANLAQTANAAAASASATPTA